MRNQRQSGMSLMEVMMALAIVSVMIFTSMTVTNQAHMMTRINTDKEFSTQKAISIIEEMKALVQSDSSGNPTILDTFDDGITTNPILTIQGTHLSATSTKTPTNADDLISGNKFIGNNQWQYERKISVQPVAGQANDVRLVNVKVFKNTPAGQILLAEVSSVIRTLVSVMPPSQVYDVYAIAIENVPGWWVYMSNVVPFVKNSINDLMARNPGLVFRTHWINSLAYGRDQEYTPFVNDAVDSTVDIGSVYFYPGVMPAAPFAGIGNNYYYPPFFFRGHVMIDAKDTNGYDAAKNPYPYALADQYNHAMRYPDEKQLFDLRHAANSNEEMTLRLLLDDMWMRPYLYTNALVINLHGELMPFPPVRNFSDAAKNPEQKAGPDLREIRVVTHPEQIRYQNTDPVKLRVYSYLTDPTIAKPILSQPISIVVRGANSWIPAAGDITGIHGGVDSDGNGTTDAYDTAPVNIPVCGGLPPTQMCYQTSLTATLAPGPTPPVTDTLIKLFNSPLQTPFDTATGRGLAYEARLYGMEYIPSPVEDLSVGASKPVPFVTNLSTVSAMPKNTARWVLRIPVASISNDQVLSVETRIGDQISSGSYWVTRDHPPNLSTTYTWRGTDLFINGNPTAAPPVPAALPPSERFQIQGDPRHCPYADLKQPPLVGKFPVGPAPPAGSYESALGMGFNRFWDDFEDGTYNAVTMAQLIAPLGPASFTISGSNNTFSLKIDGAATISVTLTTGAAKTAANVATNLNANGPFAAVAKADVVNGHLRIRSNKTNGTGSVQYDTATGTSELIFGFDNFTRTAKAWNGWTMTSGGVNYGVKNDGTIGNSGWDTSGNGNQDIDVNRLFQMVRSALQRSNAIWTTMTGWSYYYIGIGNEIGYDSANGFPNSIPVSTKPYTGSGGGYQNIDSITTGLSQGTFLIRGNPAASAWWSMPWLGELYPDSYYDAAAGQDWMNSGNLPTGTAAGTFVRDLRQNFPPFPGTDLAQSVRRTWQRGCTTMFWAGAAGATFHHNGGSGADTGAIQAAGTDIANNYSYPIPNSISSNRPFITNDTTTSMNPDFFLDDGYQNSDLTAKSSNVITQLASYYLHNSGWQSSAELALVDTSSWNPAFISVNGLSPTGVSGTTFIAHWSFLSLVESYLNGGLYTDTSAVPKGHHVKQLARVAITSPNQNTNLKTPSFINVAWSLNWQRWDAQPYTAAYPGGYSEAGVTMTYSVLYSPSNGVADKSVGSKNPTGWLYMQDDQPATIGKESLVPAEIVSSGTTYTWNTPANKFPEGSYLIRVEGYRTGLPLHYSYHQFRAYISR